MFEQVKEIIASPPILRKPDIDIPLLVYITSIEYTISATLMQEVDDKQEPVYFVRGTLQDPETWYQMVEKVALSLVTTARRLRPYFHNH